MDSISASEQGIENNVNNKQFLPRKPVSAKLNLIDTFIFEKI
jgi:hypothetical protein